MRRESRWDAISVSYPRQKNVEQQWGVYYRGMEDAPKGVLFVVLVSKHLEFIHSLII